MDSKDQTNGIPEAKLPAGQARHVGLVWFNKNDMQIIDRLPKHPGKVCCRKILAGSSK